MIKINLLPAEDAKKRTQADLAILGGIIGGILVVALLGMFVLRKAKLSRLGKDIKIAKSELQKYQAIANEVDRLKEEKSKLEQRRNIIRALIAGRLTYPKLMDEFIASIPKAIWVTNLNTKSSGDTVDMNISASSFSNFAIADWITILEDSKSFSKVELGAINATEKPDPKRKEKKMRVLSFQIKCIFRRI